MNVLGAATMNYMLTTWVLSFTHKRKLKKQKQKNKINYIAYRKLLGAFTVFLDIYYVIIIHCEIIFRIIKHISPLNSHYYNASDIVFLNIF